MYLLGKHPSLRSSTGWSKAALFTEHGHFLGDIVIGEDAWDIQKKYLGAERLRREYLSGLSSEKLVLLHRSFVSMAAHVAALKH